MRRLNWSDITRKRCGRHEAAASLASLWSVHARIVTNIVTTPTDAQPRPGAARNFFNEQLKEYNENMTVRT